MIVYNVGRQWFGLKRDAEACRRFLRLPPAATLTITVRDRDDLADLLNALCEPAVLPDTPTVVNSVDLAPLVDRAFVEPQRNVPDYVPLFLIDPAQRVAVKADREARGVTGLEE
jgi:hypothetical protein